MDDLLMAVSSLARRVDVGIQQMHRARGRASDRVESNSRLVRAARPVLRRLNGQRDDLRRIKREPRENGDSVVSALIVERFAEYDVHAGQPLQRRNMILARGTLRPAVYFLEENNVRGRVPNDLRDPLQVMLLRSVLARVNVVGEDAQLAAAATGKRGASAQKER